MKISIKEKIYKLYKEGALHIIFGTFITKFVSFFGSAFVVRILSKQDYGLLNYVETFFGYAIIFAGLGLSNSLLRYVVIADEDDKKSYYSYILKKSFFYDLVIVFCLIVINLIKKHPSNYLGAESLIFFISLLLPFQDVITNNLNLFRSLFNNKLYAYFSIVISIMTIGARIIGAILNGTKGVIIGRLIICIILSLLSIVYINNNSFKINSIQKIEDNKKHEIKIYGLQYMITNGFWAIFMLNDTFLLAELLNNPIELADFKAACLLPNNISIFAAAIGTFVCPYFIKNENNREWIATNYKKTMIVNILVMALVVLGIGILAKPLIIVLYGESYLSVIPLMKILLIAAFINSGLRYPTANILASMGKIKYNMIISFVGIIMQIVLDIVLIPRFGTISVAYINCFVYSIMALFLFVIFYNKYLKN